MCVRMRGGKALRLGDAATKDSQSMHTHHQVSRLVLQIGELLRRRDRIQIIGAEHSGVRRCYFLEQRLSLLRLAGGIQGRGCID